MRGTVLVIFAACLIASLPFDSVPAKPQDEDVFITIGGGDITGVYFPVGLAIAKLINSNRRIYGIRATVEATTGSTFNLNAIDAGYLEFGLAQADKQYHAVHGQFEWAQKGPQTELRAVFSIYHESVTLVAAVDAGINNIADLKGKRVSLGNPGSSQHRIVIKTLEAAGLDPKRDIAVQLVNAYEAPALLQDNRIDAYFFTVGHPSETIRMALSGQRKARIIPISGPAIDALVASRSFYTKMPLQMHRLYPGLEGERDVVDTFGMMATLCTSASVGEDVVYYVTKMIFENFAELRRQHPALSDFTRQNIFTGLSAPLHPGALRYYREAGLMK